MIDFSTRLWYLKIHPEKKGIYIVNEKSNFQLISTIKKFLDVYGVSSQISFVNTPTKYKCVIIPQPSYITNYYYSREYMDMFDEVANRIENIDKNKKYVYFTRTKFGKAQKTEFGEKVIEDRFRRAGFYVVSPENCSLDEQISLIRNAQVIAAVSGTITHNMLFAKKGQKIFIVNKTYVLNLMQMDVNLMKELDVVYIDSYVSPLPISLGFGPFLLRLNEETKKCFKKELGIDIVEEKEELQKDYQRYVRSFSVMYYCKYNCKLNFQDEYNSVHYYDRSLSDEGKMLLKKLNRMRIIKKLFYGSLINGRNFCKYILKRLR